LRKPFTVPAGDEIADRRSTSQTSGRLGHGGWLAILRPTQGL